MAGNKLTVVISQSQGRNPARRDLEEEMAAALVMDADVDTSLVPHLYDMTRDHAGMLFLQSVPGDIVVLSWLYPRAARWVLDRCGVKGHQGVTLLESEHDLDDEQDGAGATANKDRRGVGSVDVPDRKIYCLDLRSHSDPKVYLEEISRIAGEQSAQTIERMQFIQGGVGQTFQSAGRLESLPHIWGFKDSAPATPRDLHPERVLAARKSNSDGSAAGNGNGSADVVPEPVKRRWYPVIDYDRCTNCMECIDFCLFGVYGIDHRDRILVEEQNNCKKGCPACSRVCPAGAIIFPGHKTPAIAGADGEPDGMKIDLSTLFGAPSALELADMERDTELAADGRKVIGTTVGIPKRQAHRVPPRRDELDDLMDGLDGLDL